jgi:hypothetical protein
MASRLGVPGLSVRESAQLRQLEKAFSHMQAFSRLAQANRLLR